MGTAVNGHLLPTVVPPYGIDHGAVAKSEDLDQETKDRIAANLRQKMQELRVSKRQLALKIGIKPPSLVKILNATRNVGTAVLVKIHRNLHMDLNRLVDIDPPREFFVFEEEEPAHVATARAAKAKPPRPRSESPPIQRPATRHGSGR